MRVNPSTNMHPRQGFTLLEIFLAIAVLLIGLLAITKLTGLARRDSTQAEELAIVQLACQTKMNELLAANNRSTAAINEQPITGVRNWFLSVGYFSVGREGLLGIKILARKPAEEPAEADQRFELVRWVVAEPQAQPQRP